MKELNERQKQLYNIIKSKSKSRGWITQREINLEQQKRNDKVSGTVRVPLPFVFHSSAARRVMTEDIREINRSESIEGIIITSSKGVKLATKEEFEEYVKIETKTVFRRLKQLRNKIKKAGLDGQIKIDIDEDGKDTINVFI